MKTRQREKLYAPSHWLPNTAARVDFLRHTVIYSSTAAISSSICKVEQPSIKQWAQPFFPFDIKLHETQDPQTYFSPTEHITPTFLYIAHLDELRESSVDWRPDWRNLFPKIDRSQRTLRDACSGELKPGIDVLVGAGGAETVEAELLVRVFFPSLDVG